MGVVDEASTSVEHFLKATSEVVRKAGQDSGAVVEAGVDERCDEGDQNCSGD